MRSEFCVIGLVAFIAGGARAEDRTALVWPTPNEAFAQNKPLEAILQHAGSGDPESGGFGCVRSNGTQFHEGIDIKAVNRDRRGEPTDDIYAAMDGVVSYINGRAGESSYGRYIVLEHPAQTPAVYTLYAHLSSVAPNLKVGDHVARGSVMATMGHTAGGYAIPRERAHLHFEMGLWITRNFQAWYTGRKFGSPNEHGLYNGMNLMGFDPLDFMRQLRAHTVNNFQEYISRMDETVRVRIATSRTPDFMQRYPSLRTKEPPMLVAGWEVKFNWTGLPIAFTPLAFTEVAGLASEKPEVVYVNAEIERQHRCKSLAVARRGGGWTIGRDLEIVLEQLFGVK